jgi:hypothetical protein
MDLSAHWHLQSDAAFLANFGSNNAKLFQAFGPLNEDFNHLVHVRI